MIIDKLPYYRTFEIIFDFQSMRNRMVLNTVNPMSSDDNTHEEKMP